MNAHSEHPKTLKLQPFDASLVRQHVEMLHKLAATLTGDLVVCCYGEDPLRIDIDTGKLGAQVHSQVWRFAVGEIEPMVEAVMGWNGVLHANVYIPLHVVRKDLPRGKRGKKEDIVAVLGLVADMDADTGKTGSLPPGLEPSLIVETSPGNSHPFILFDRPISATDAEPLAKALKRATGTDGGTGDVAHVWRVPGTANWPAATKLARGRSSDPAPVKLLKPWDGTLLPVDAVRKALSPWMEADKAGGDSAGPKRNGCRPLDELLRCCSAATKKLITAAPGPQEDRSAVAFSVLCTLIGKKFSDAEIKLVFEAHPNGIGDRYVNDNKSLDAEIGRAHQKANFHSSETEGTSVGEHLQKLNQKYCVVMEGGKTRVMFFEDDGVQTHHRRFTTSFMSFDDFRNFHCNQKIQVADEKAMQLGAWWLRHPNRRQYEGLTFQPGGDEIVEGRLNLWRGWGVEPKPGVWRLMRTHIEEVLAGGDGDAATYILNWIAWAFQHPAERAQAALVFKGKKGSGKGTLGNALTHIFGQHGTHISSADHLAGRFNGHLRDACLLFADEAYWPGDKAAEGSLKRLITEPDLFIEAKGRNGVTVKNMLHVIMASNDEWIVPAGEDERRYAVFNVAEHKKQIEAWFQPLYAELANEGYAAMLHDLLAVDLGDWHPRRIPKNGALLDQQKKNLSYEDSWWVELLETGSLWGSTEKEPNRAVSNHYMQKKANGYGGERDVKVLGLYDQARSISPRLRQHTDHALGAALAGHGCKNSRKVSRRQGWTFPNLSEARNAWKLRFPSWDWRDPDLTEWHYESPAE